MEIWFLKKRMRYRRIQADFFRMWLRSCCQSRDNRLQGGALSFWQIQQRLFSGAVSEGSRWLHERITPPVLNRLMGMSD